MLRHTHLHWRARGSPLDAAQKHRQMVEQRRVATLLFDMRNHEQEPPPVPLDTHGPTQLLETLEPYDFQLKICKRGRFVDPPYFIITRRREPSYTHSQKPKMDGLPTMDGLSTCSTRGRAVPTFSRAPRAGFANHLVCIACAFHFYHAVRAKRTKMKEIFCVDGERTCACACHTNDAFVRQKWRACNFSCYNMPRSHQ